MLPIKNCDCAHYGPSASLINRVKVVSKISILYGSILSASLLAPVHSHAQESGPEAAFQRAVHIKIALPERSGEVSGTGAWLDGNTVITASHLFPDDLRENERLTIEIVTPLGNLPAKVVTASHPSELDLAVLAVDPSANASARRSAAPLKLCSTPLQPGQKVSVAAANQSGLAVVIPTHGSFDRSSIYRGVVTSHSVTTYLAPGTSGASVFDEATGCLAGIVSKQEKHEDTTNGVFHQVFTTGLVSVADIAPVIAEIRK
ncbi:TPA: trypsin-like peptidase domain-containing protein [Stenotrophomonas maltophilia]|nr:trypsin-like peptidase domain-containing protein [Stenotrophomonas maltophilia]